MRLHPPSVHPKTQNTERTHFGGQPEQNKAAPTPPTNPLSSPPNPWYPYSAQPLAAGDIVITRGGRPTRPDYQSMPLTRRFLLSFCTAGLIFAQPAPQKHLPARDLFYAAAPAPAAVKPVAARPPARRSTATPAKPVEIARADSRPPAP